MPRNNNYRPTTVQYEPKKRQYGKTKLAETDSMEAIDMGPMMCECHLYNISCFTARTKSIFAQNNFITIKGITFQFRIVNQFNFE